MISNFLKKKANSFKYAFSGLKDLWIHESNTRIHLLFTVLVAIMCLWLKVDSGELCVLVLIIGAVWSAEAMNSALERVVDLVTLEKKPLAKAAKDLAAGSVLIMAIASVVIGLVIFLPKIAALFVPNL
ncbi:MAG: diacylglycerol kinase family protein [Flexilinea sp.]|nr:diacylglycerol kinase family protein [Flexilinea sp.]